MLNFASAAEQYQKVKLLKKLDVESLMEWCRLEPHLPMITEFEALVFLHACSYNNELAKKCIDTFFTYRTNCPEFFSLYDPREIQTTLNALLICLLPKLMPTGECIIYIRLTNTDPGVFNFHHAVRAIDMFIKLYLFEHGCLPGYILVIDMEGAQLTHLFKIKALSLKKLVSYILTAIPLRFESVHFVNSFSLMDKILAMVRPLVRKEELQRLHCHYGSNSTIFEYISEECLPKECGGKIEGIMDIFAEQREHLEQNRAFFLQEAEKCVDESKRPGEKRNIADLFGIEGTFKKLDLD